MNVIEAEGLRKEFTVRRKTGRFRREPHVVPAVDGVNLTVERGELLGYLGPNGAGKSTTLKMLTGVLVPTGGHLRVCGFTPVPQRRKLARRHAPAQHRPRRDPALLRRAGCAAHDTSGREAGLVRCAARNFP